jgi:branched-chain amino acid aminotransferase
VIARETPQHVFFRGRIQPWPDATIHLWSDAVVHGATVFDGIRGYRQPDGSIALVLLEAHVRRLLRSAKIFRFPYDGDAESIASACQAAARAVAEDADMVYVRPTLYLEGHSYTVDRERAELFVPAFPESPREPRGIRVAFTVWRRAPDVALPARVKFGASYQLARLARLEAAERGLDDMIFLNSDGRVAEATGACLLIVRDGVVCTPPATEGALESVTVGAVERLCADLSIAFERRPVERTELFVADEVALASTAMEITPVEEVDGLAVERRSDLLAELWRHYRDAVTGRAPRPFISLDRL